MGKRRWVAATLATALLIAAMWPSGCAMDGDGDTLVIAVEAAPRSLDPRLGSIDGVAARLHQLVFDTLVRKNERFEIVPHLANSFEQSPDAKTFTFRLRPGVTFHNGQPLTSADVKYTFDTIRSPELNSPVRAAFNRLEAIEAPDDLTVVFRARESYYTLLGDLVAIGIIAQGTSETQKDRPVGTGPFRVVDHTEQTVDLEANPDYFSGRPQVEKVRVRVVADNNTRELELKNEDIDLAINTGFSPDTVAKMQSDPELQVVVTEGTNIDHIGLNTTDERLGKVAVRQAIAYGLDRNMIIETLLRGQARAADAIMPPEAWAYDPEVAKYPHDVARAKALLDSAGFPDPDGDGPQTRQITITFTTSNVGMAPAIGQIVQEQLKAIGINVELEQFERNTFFDRLNQGTFDLYYARSVGGNQTPDVFQWAYQSRYSNPELDQAATSVRTASNAGSVAGELATMLGILERREYCPSAEIDRLIADARAADPEARRTNLLEAYDLVAARGAGNRSRYCNPSLNDLIVRAERSTDRAEQKQLFSQVQKTASQEVPQIYLWYPANIVVARKRVGNINIDLSGAWYFVKDVTLQQ
jgi:peptide/nickel transport system substrate-binding protein